MKKKNLLAKRNVVSIGMGEKFTKGLSTGKTAYVVGVTKKLPIAQLKKKDLIPSNVEGMPTDVIEVGEIKLLADDPTDKFRPCPAGVSVGHYQITAGTLGAWVKKDSHWHILSNNHVLANVNQAKIGDPILQPGHADGGSNPVDAIATLKEFVPISMTGDNGGGGGGDDDDDGGKPGCNWFAGLAKKLSAFVSEKSNTVDCALAMVKKEADVHAEILEIGAIAGASEGFVGDMVQKHGRTTGLTTAKVSQRNVTVTVQMGSGKTAIFEDQLLIQAPGFSKPGDSGSAVLNKDKCIVGLLFAGSDTVTIVNRYSNVKLALGIEAP